MYDAIQYTKWKFSKSPVYLQYIVIKAKLQIFPHLGRNKEYVYIPYNRSQIGHKWSLSAINWSAIGLFKCHF